MRDAMATSLAATSSVALGPPPGLTSPPSSPAKRPLGGLPPGLLDLAGGEADRSLDGSPFADLRRCSSGDPPPSREGHLRPRHPSLDPADDCPSPSPSPWAALPTGGAEARQGDGDDGPSLRASLSSSSCHSCGAPQPQPQPHRLRSRGLDPVVLRLGSDHLDDDESLHSSPETGDRGSVFRRSARPPAAHSLIVGSPSRGGRGADAASLWSDGRAGRGSFGGSLRGGGGDRSAPPSPAWGAPPIQTSLSCPTSVFESPLFPSSRGGSSSNLDALGRRAGESLESSVTLLLLHAYPLEKIVSASGEQGSPNQSLNQGTDLDGTYDESELLDGDESHGEEEDPGRHDDPLEDENRQASVDRKSVEGLDSVDVSVIECDQDDESPFRRIPPAAAMEGTAAKATSSADADAAAGGRPASAGSAGGANPMRNLSGAFELLVADGEERTRVSAGGGVPPSLPPVSPSRMTTVTDLERHLEVDAAAAASGDKKARGGSGEQTDSTTADASKSINGSESGSSEKPSPTSVMDLEGSGEGPSSSSPSPSSPPTSNSNADENPNETKPPPPIPKAVPVRLENDLVVASVPVPRFRLLESLRGNLSQGLVDRVSFYSVVRDINKEAGDAAATDPRGSTYNDGTVHGRWAEDRGVDRRVKGKGAVPPLPPRRGRKTAGHVGHVVAEDGQVHIHPDPAEEQRSFLVAACAGAGILEEGDEGEREPGNNPNEALPPDVVVVGQEGEGTGQDAPPAEGEGGGTPQPPPELGAALLDEEWWLVSAIASRDPADAAADRGVGLPPTFYEAMGEKEAGEKAPAAECQGSRTQLWKPGRSWWEAKSGKNPWVEPVVHNNRWRYLWPLIHYHKFIAKCIKKLKRNGVDVKTSASSVSLFLRQEVCHVSDHLAFMSKYDSEEWTSALRHFEGWTDHDPAVAGTLQALVSSQRLVGLQEVGEDVTSSLLRSQIDDRILEALRAMREEGGKEAYDYNDASARRTKGGGVAAVNMRDRGPNPSFSTLDDSQGSSFPGRGAAWADDSHLRVALESQRRTTIENSGWGGRAPGYPPHLPPPYPRHPDAYGRPPYGPHHPPYDPAAGYPPYGGPPMNYYPPPPHPYNGYGQYPPPHPHMGYHGEMPYAEHYGHHPSFYGGYYSEDGSFHDGSFTESMTFDSSGMHSQDPQHYIPHAAQTPCRYNGGGPQPGAHYPASPYWGHLNLSQLPGVAASPSIHVTPSKPPRGGPGRSYRKRQQQQGQSQGKGGSAIDGKAKSLIMFPNHTNSPASRFVMSPQDKSNPYYAPKDAATPKVAPSANVASAPSSSSQAAAGPDREGSFVLPPIGNYGPGSPSAGDGPAHTSLRSDTSLELMPPAVKKMYMKSSSSKGGAQEEKKLREVSEHS